MTGMIYLDALTPEDVQSRARILWATGKYSRAEAEAKAMDQLERERISREKANLHKAPPAEVK
jgi:hypothetical protein